jgi:hypothetical protein
MTKEEYLDYGKKYLKLTGIMAQIEFDSSIKKKFPVAKYNIFKRWMHDVDRHESHRSLKQSDDWYLNRLKVWLSPKK